jgi:hypothetical protein
LTGPNADGSRFHVYYSAKGSTTSPPYASLDVDNTHSFGPETITITQFNSGVYRFSVHDFTDRASASSTALGTSGARVDLYYTANNIGQLTSYFVPNESGTLWTVFEMSGSLTHPTITVRNEMGIATDPSTITLRSGSGTAPITDADVIGLAVSQHLKGKGP